MPSTNQDVAALLAELAVLTMLEDESAQSFRVRAYENAVTGLRGLTEDVAGMTVAELVNVKGVGKSTATKIREYVDTGSIVKLEKLRSKYPPELVELTRIPGLGPKTLMLVRSELGVESVDDLRAALAEHKLRDLPGLGSKTEENLVRNIERLGLHGKERRTPIAEALPIARRIVDALAELAGAGKVRYCGSLRRFRESIGDVDIVASSRRSEPIMERFVGLPVAAEVLAHGETKSAILTRQGLQVDLRVVTPAEFGAASLYFTGSKAHNIKLRQLAIDRGWILNEYGLSVTDTDEVVASRTEKAIYRALGLDYIPAPLREDAGEVELAARGSLPRLVRREDIKGDLHYHTDLSGDGRSSLTEMIAAGAAAGYRYLAITDHGEDLAINGASRRQMRAQRRQLAAIAADHPELTLLHGCELNIGSDGGLDYDPDFLLEFDWCVASVHSHFDLDQAQQTRRVIAAMTSPAVNAIGHLSGRMIGRRPGIELDVPAVLEAAVDTGTALEINGALDRLDASDDVLAQARGRGVTFVISTDSHHTSELVRMDHGVQHAQRGWVERSAVANTWATKKFTRWVRRKRESG